MRRKLQTTIMDEHLILHGAIMMILMSISGEIFAALCAFIKCHALEANNFSLSGHFIVSNLAGHGAKIHPFFKSQNPRRFATFS